MRNLSISIWESMSNLKYPYFNSSYLLLRCPRGQTHLLVDATHPILKLNSAPHSGSVDSPPAASPNWAHRGAAYQRQMLRSKTTHPLTVRSI